MAVDVATLRARISFDTRELEQGAQKATRTTRKLAADVEQDGKALDKALSGSMASAAKSVDTGFAKVASGATASLQSVGKAFAGVSSNAASSLRGLTTAFGNSATGARSLAASINSTLHPALLNTAKLAAGAGVALGAAFTAAGAGIAKAGVDMNLAVKGAEAAATVISGSNDAAKRFVQGLREESQISTLTFKELLPLSQSLAAAFNQVYGAQGLDRVRGTLRTFGDVAVTLGANANSMQLALNGFQQLLTSDTPTMEDIKQISENLPGSGALSIVKQAFGTTQGDELAEAGVTGAMVAEAILQGMEQKFGGAQQRAAGTLPVLLSNFQDAFNNLAASVTERFLPILTGAVEKLLQAFQALAGSERFIQALEVPFMLLGRALEYVATQTPAIVEWMEAVLTRENIVNVLSQIVGWFVAIKATAEDVWKWIVGDAKNSVVGAFQWLGQVAHTVIDTILRSWNVLTASIEYLANNADTIWGIFTDAMNPVKTTLDTINALMERFLGLLNDPHLQVLLDIAERVGKMLLGNGNGSGAAMFGLSAPAGGGTMPAGGGTMPAPPPGFLSEYGKTLEGVRGGAATADSFFGGIGRGVNGFLSGVGKGVQGFVETVGQGPARWAQLGQEAFENIRRGVVGGVEGMGRNHLAQQQRQQARPGTGVGGGAWDRTVPGRISGLLSGLGSVQQSAWNQGLPAWNMPQMPNFTESFGTRQMIGADLAKDALNGLLGPTRPNQATGRERHMLYGQRQYGTGGVSIAPNMTPAIPEYAPGVDITPRYAPGGGPTPLIGNVTIQPQNPEQLRAQLYELVEGLIAQTFPK